MREKMHDKEHDEKKRKGKKETKIAHIFRIKAITIKTRESLSKEYKNI